MKTVSHKKGLILQEQSATFIGVNKYLEYVWQHHRSHNILLAAFSTFLSLLYDMLVGGCLNRKGKLCLVRLPKTPNKDIKAAVADWHENVQQK